MSAWLIDLVVYGVGVSWLVGGLVGGLVTVRRGIGVKAEVWLLTVGFVLLAVAPVGVAVGDWGGVGLVEWSAKELRAPVEERVEVVAVPEIERGEVPGTLREVGEVGEVGSGGEVVELEAVRRTDWVKVTGVVWGGVFVVLIGCWCWRALRWWGWCRRRLREMGDERVLEFCEGMGIERRRVWTLDGAVSPFVTGLLWPRVVIGEGTVARLSDGELGMVLRHEMAHLRRGDLWWGIVVKWVCCCFWWNPLVWIGGQRLRGLVEELCDRAGAGDAAGAAGYARLLLRVSEARLSGAGGVAMAGSDVGRRIGRVLGEDGWRERSGWVGKLVVGILLVIGLGGFGVRYSSGDEKEKNGGGKWLEVVDGKSVEATEADVGRAMSFDGGFVLVFDGAEVRAGRAKTEVNRGGALAQVELGEGVRGKLLPEGGGEVVEISGDRGRYRNADGKIVLEGDGDGESGAVGEVETVIEKSVPITPPKPPVPAGGDLQVIGASMFFHKELGIVRWNQSGDERVKLRFHGVEIEARSVEYDERRNLLTAEGAAMEREGFKARAKKIEIRPKSEEGEVRMEFRDVVVDQVIEGRATRFEAEAFWYSVRVPD